MFPKVSRKIDNHQVSIFIQFLKENMEIILNKEKCVGCCVCLRVCPKEAISKGPIGASRRFPTLEDIIPVIYNPTKCLFCGICVYMCPFSALTLRINGEIVELYEIPIVERKAVPSLEFKTKKLENGRIMKQYFDGKLSLNTKDCPGGCSTCVNVCPSAAFSLATKPDKGWEKSSMVQVDQEKCVFCGACENACPTNAVKLEITDIKFSGEFIDPFWSNLMIRLKN